MENKYEDLLLLKMSNSKKKLATEELEAHNLVLTVNNLYEKLIEKTQDTNQPLSVQEMTAAYKLTKLRTKLLIRGFYRIEATQDQILEEVVEECQKLLTERPYLAAIIKEELTYSKNLEQYQKPSQVIDFPVVEDGVDLESSENSWLKYYIYDKLNNTRIGKIRTQKNIMYKELEDIMEDGIMLSHELTPEVSREDAFIFLFYYVMHFFNRIDDSFVEKCVQYVQLWDKQWSQQLKDVQFADWETGVPIRLDSCMNILKAFLTGYIEDDESAIQKAKKFALTAQKQDPNNFYVFILDFDQSQESYVKNLSKTEQIILEKGQIGSLQNLRFFPLLYNKANAMWSLATLEPDTKRVKYAKQAFDSLNVSINNLHVPMDPNEVQTMGDCKLMMAEPQAAISLYKEFFEIQFTSANNHIVHAVETTATIMSGAFKLLDDAILSVERYCRLMPPEYTTTLKMHYISLLTDSPKVYQGKTLREQLEWCRKEVSKFRKEQRETLEMDEAFSGFLTEISGKIEQKMKEITSGNSSKLTTATPQKRGKVLSLLAKQRWRHAFRLVEN